MLLAVTIVAATFLPAAAASPAVVCGTVVDAAGARLGRVDVALRSSTGEALTTATDEDGNYRFAEVAAGRYTLTFTRDGFKKTVRPNLDVRDDGDVPADQRLEASSLPGETVVVDPSKVTVGVTTKTVTGSYSKQLTKRGDAPRPCKER